MLQIEATDVITEEGTVLAQPGARGLVLGAEEMDDVIAVTVRFPGGITTAYVGEDCELVKPEFEFTGICSRCGELVSDGRAVHRECSA